MYFRPALDGRMDGDGNSKLMIYNLERAIRLMPRHSWQYTIVIDCEGRCGLWCRFGSLRGKGVVSRMAIIACGAR